ncbi:MAG: hypothetical protein J07HB67_00807 [halophilic archaeon J07HB67]|nr:MAG: hypothetical protein J07HB67_00807 [halophilic archaeon J07HB67]
MSTTEHTAEQAQTDDETEVVTDGGSQTPRDPAKALLEDAAGL